jgi:hypothetical protein
MVRGEQLWARKDRSDDNIHTVDGGWPLKLEKSTSI